MIKRRLGSTPQQRGSASGQTCPDMFELEDGRILVIGAIPQRVRPPLFRQLAEHGGSIGDMEAAVIIPKRVLLDAMKQIEEESDG